MANVPKIHKLKANIADCKQGGLDVVEFYSKLSNLWSELEYLVKMPYCTCSGCKCEAGSKMAKKLEDERAHQFLMGLNDKSYSHIISQILATESFLSLDRIFNMILQKENHKKLM